MASKTIIELIDDLDEGQADETVSFALDGSSYEIDLSDKNAKSLRDVLAKYVGSARKARGSAGRGNASPGRPAGTRPAKADREQTQAIRDWARSHDYKVGDKGRIPASIVEAYNAAGGGTPVKDDGPKNDAADSAPKNGKPAGKQASRKSQSKAGDKELVDA